MTFLSSGNTSVEIKVRYGDRLVSLEDLIFCTELVTSLLDIGSHTRLHRLAANKIMPHHFQLQTGNNCLRIMSVKKVLLGKQHGFCFTYRTHQACLGMVLQE